MAYDSRPDTYAHIAEVRARVLAVAADLVQRADRHDASKLTEPELAVFDEHTPRLAGLTYGSEEYEASREAMGAGLAHHYRHNDHHPEHHPGGVHDMDLAQMVEMLADWKAATLRHADGDLGASITMNAERFGYGAAVARLLRNTAERYGWL